MRDILASIVKRAPSAFGRCARCVYFDADARSLEAQLPGLVSLSSGFASVRGDDGLCLLHRRVLGADSSCGDFEATATKSSAGAQSDMCDSLCVGHRPSPG